MAFSFPYLQGEERRQPTLGLCRSCEHTNREPELPKSYHFCPSFKQKPSLRSSEPPRPQSFMPQGTVAANRLKHAHVSAHSRALVLEAGFPLHIFIVETKKGVGQQGLQLLGLDWVPVLTAQQAPGYQVMPQGTGNREKEGKGRFGVSAQLKQLVSGSQHMANFSPCLTYAESLQSTCPLPGHL